MSNLYWSSLGGKEPLEPSKSQTFSSLLEQAKETETPVILNFGTVSYVGLICETLTDYFTWMFAKDQNTLFKSANRYSELVQIIYCATDWSKKDDIPLTGQQMLNLPYESDDSTTTQQIDLSNYWDYFSVPSSDEEDFDEDNDLFI